ncbi:unnamed protein product [Lasius platythorax]|uniref:Uncharacterized protein n=1 Tax=Lasius platythorax TaxID=488582 RepID=A0AAV2NNC1_9HYME
MTCTVRHLCVKHAHQRCTSADKALLYALLYGNVGCKTNPQRGRPGSGLRIMRLVAHSAPLCNNKYGTTDFRHSRRNPPLPLGSSNYAAITSIINNRYPLISNPVQPTSE